jgi:hypothetical protein
MVGFSEAWQSIFCWIQIQAGRAVKKIAIGRGALFYEYYYKISDLPGSGSGPSPAKPGAFRPPKPDPVFNWA